ncbi:FMN reductase [Arthrobacter sp. E44]|uniref:FMN reductase n=1 Tax=Arthrobacter sp. E44 TaxID=3341794 RepID=UPI0035A5B39C
MATTDPIMKAAITTAVSSHREEGRDRRPPKLRVVTVSGTLNSPSKTDALLDAIVDSLAQALRIEVCAVRVSDLGPQLAAALTQESIGEQLHNALSQIETADLLIVASPVYRSSYTGLFKHLFDLIGRHSLVNVPVFLAATGGSEKHALILEHSLRPLFGCFEALTLPIGVYAHGDDFTGGRVTGPDVLKRIDQSISQSVPLILLRSEERWNAEPGQ